MPAFAAVELLDVGVGRGRDDVAIAGGDEGQVAVQIARVQAVAEHELVVEHEAAVAQLVRHDAPRRAVEQRARRQATAGPGSRSWPIRYASVRPVSTMSSTTTTSRPLMSESRSWRIFTRPESGANREIDMKSSSTGTPVIARARSATKISAPFSTPTSTTPSG